MFHSRATSPLLLGAALLVASPLQAAPLASGALARAPGPAAGSTPAVPRTDPQASALQADAYLLGAGDGLVLTFLAAKELSGPVAILNDGTASLPLLGNVQLAGLTLSQATQWLEKLYQRQLLRPNLQLTVVRPRPLRVALVGEVTRPGLYTLTTSEASNTDARVTISGLPALVDAIQKAGGITANADLSQVVLQRRLHGTAPRFKRTSVNLLALLREGDQLQNPLLFDGDTIRVPRAEEPVAEAIELSATTLAPQEIKVNVVGEVERPGPVTLSANTPLVQAVLAAGGTKAWRASRGSVELVRINRNGTATRRFFALDLSQGASNAKNPPLRDGDTVVVNRNSLAKASDTLNAISQPLTSLTNMLALIQLLNNTR